MERTAHCNIYNIRFVGCCTRPAQQPFFEEREGNSYEGTAISGAPGRYRHFKGKEYEVLGVARHSETEDELVVYRALYGDFGLWVRPVSMWNETVERDGKTFRRFTYIGE